MSPKRRQMTDIKRENSLKTILESIPTDWLKLTTHRLDIYNEARAKSDFLEQFEALFESETTSQKALENLPTAYDYIRLGHPLSSVLEWTLAHQYGVHPAQVISFSSQVMPLLAVLRKNVLDGKNTIVHYTDKLPASFDEASIKRVYGYTFDVKKISQIDEIGATDASKVFISSDQRNDKLNANVDFYLFLYDGLGSIILANGEQSKSYVSEIQHVRRRESIAMTPANCLSLLEFIVGDKTPIPIDETSYSANRLRVASEIKSITSTSTTPLLASSGLSIQYAIMMGLIDHALEQHPGTPIRFVVPPNCYGGTNDQARRVAACLPNVEILDLPVDGQHNMVESLDKVLHQVATENAIAYIIAEIPTNPRVEVPDLEALRSVLTKQRTTPQGNNALAPVFILDQTFCPNVPFTSADGILNKVQTISYVSGSKFPSGGKCTAGYCVTNDKAAALMTKIEQHLILCDNQATPLQVAILAEQLPSMLDRIAAAYENTRKFVDFIQATLPEAKINFVSEELAQQGFTPSVFSLDLPTKGATPEAREAHKRKLNDRLIELMITKIPTESKYCVSYGQLKGCYWTIPATSTQGTTKEADKDYIARVSVSPDLDLEQHQQVFNQFVAELAQF